MGILWFSLLFFIGTWGCLSNYTTFTSHCGTKLIIKVFLNLFTCLLFCCLAGPFPSRQKISNQSVITTRMWEISDQERSSISLHPFRQENDFTSQARNLRLPDFNLENLQLIITLKLVFHASFCFLCCFYNFSVLCGYQNYLLEGIY